ncbi:hypothetical protein M0805_008592 [Coniferiporia weirii]|nr:hypothetical protein M0805_008592 [Coniferiporia weirii]
MVTISDSIISVMVILRLYAVYLGKLWVPLFLGGLALIQFSFGIRATTGVTLLSKPPGVSGCVLTVKDDAYQSFALLWGASVFFDASVFFLTLWKTFQYRSTSNGTKVRLIDLFLRDGIIYFIAMFSAKVVNFTVFWIVSRDLITINWTFNHTITVILISRLFFNLRNSSNDTNGLGTITTRSWNCKMGLEDGIGLEPLSIATRRIDYVNRDSL